MVFDSRQARGHRAGPPRDRQYLFVQECKLDPWWSATINVEYEAARGVVEKDGRRKGYMICVTKTITAPVDKAYAAWATSEGLNEWFSTKNKAEVADGGRYSNADGDTGVFKRVRKTRTFDSPGRTRLTLRQPSSTSSSRTREKERPG